MAVPWLRLLDAIIGVTDLARSRRMGRLGPAPEASPSTAVGALGQIETRLAGVVVAALKEAFDRDSRRLELEREQMEAERRRAERALQLELARQAAEREMGRLRLVAGIAVASWIGTLFLAARLAAGSLGGRITIGCGWALLLAALAAAFAGQSRVGAQMARAGDLADLRPASSGAGAAAPWLVVAGIALVCVGVLIA